MSWFLAETFSTIRVDGGEEQGSGETPVNTAHPVHPQGIRAQVLLSSVFGPYAQDDPYGSRKINPMELFHNQVTRVQGPFSLRMFHRSFGLMLIHANMDAPCTLLDFPTMDRFIQELQCHPYDIVGISGIMTNVGKVKQMCALVRQHLPRATVVVGGHVANMPDLHRRIDADHIVRGDGVRWFRKFLGQEEDQPVRHPLVHSGFGTRTLGTSISDGADDVAAILLPSVGCPIGCNFCSTSHMFGGKGKHIDFYKTGDDLFRIMRQLEEQLNTHSFGIMDENFLIHRKRALRLLELLERDNRSWSLSVFSSANVLKSYTIEQLVGLGVSWVWMGLEGKDSQYAKLHGADTRTIVRDLQAHGIRVLGSSIIGLEHHAPETIDSVIDWAVTHNTDFHQFMLYTPIPGTPLYEEHRKAGNLLPEGDMPCADAHGQLRFNYRHKHIRDGQESEILLRAFQQDFKINGPSMARMIRTTLAGWRRYKKHPSQRIRRRYEWEARNLATMFAGTIWAMKRWYREDQPMKKKIDAIFQDLCLEFGWRTRIMAGITGRVMYVRMKREAERLAKGWTYEPQTFYEMNRAMLSLMQTKGVAGTPIRWVSA